MYDLLQNILPCAVEWPPRAGMVSQPLSKKSDAELLSLLKQGTHSQRHEAFTVFYDRYYQDVWRYTLSLVQCEDTAKELFSEIWLVVVEKLTDFELKKNAKGTPVKSWLFNIAKNKAYEVFRLRKSPLLDINSPEVIQQVYDFILTEIEMDLPEKTNGRNSDIRLEADGWLLKAMQEAKLTKQEKKVVTLVYFADKNSTEISEELKIKSNYVRQLHLRAKGKLAKVLVLK